MTVKVRRLDKNHDWTFGQGFANYASESEAIAQIYIPPHLFQPWQTVFQIKKPVISE